MKVIKYPLSEDKTNINVVLTGDFHLGNSACDMAKIKKVLNFVKEGDDRYIILNGDLLDCIVGGDKRYDSESVDIPTIESQMALLQELLTPIKEKVIAMTEGNHSVSIYKRVGINPERYIANALSIPFLGFNGFITITRKHKSNVIIYVTHGSTAGGTVGNTLNKLDDLTRYYQADIYISGHSHQCLFNSRPILYPAGREIIQKELLFINSGGYLNLPKYALQRGYPALSLKTPVLRISYNASQIKKDIFYL